MPEESTARIDAAGASQARQARPHKRGELLPFPTLKRPRGRPRKDRTQAPAPEDFDVIAAAIVGLHASEHVWRRAAAEQRLGMQQRRLRPTTIAVVDYVTERLNRAERHGFDWHSADQIAGVLGVEARSVKRAFQEAGATGFAKRRRAGAAWQTTLPRMVRLCMDVQGQLDASQGQKRGTRKGAQGDQKTPRGTNNSAGGPEIGDRGTKKANQGDQKGPKSTSPPHPPYRIPEKNPKSAQARASAERRRAPARPFAPVTIADTEVGRALARLAQSMVVREGAA